MSDLTPRATAAAELLESIVDDRGLLAHLDEDLRQRLLMAAGRVARPSKDDRRRLARARRKKQRKEAVAQDTQLLDQTGIRRGRANPIFQTPRRRGEAPPPPIGTLHEERTCYVCRAKYTEVHHFYDHMCLACGDLNFAKRDPEADLLFISCTALRASLVLDQIEQSLGKPVLSSNQVLAWHSLQLVGYPQPISGFGRLLAEHPARTV